MTDLDETQIGAAEAPQWAVDLIETELSRAGPDGLSKTELQQAVGLGTDDLRTALEDALAQGVVVIDEDAYKPGPGLGAAGADPDGAPEEAGPTDGPVDAEVYDPEAGQSYRTRIALEVTWAPDGPEEATDDAARRIAGDFRDLVAQALSRQYPDLSVGAAVESVDVLGTVRRIQG